MYSFFYLVIALVDFIILVWALRLLSRYPTNGLLYATVPLTFLWVDNFAVGIGRFLGEGDLLLYLTYIRYLAHYIGMPLSIIALGAMAREAGFAWAQPKAVMALFCLVAVFFIVDDMYIFLQLDFYPACVEDTFRYLTQVSEDRACSPDSFVGGDRVPPFAPITFTVGMIALGLLLWWRDGWKWMALGSICAMPLFAAPSTVAGGILGNVGEPILSFAFVASAAWIARTFPQSS